MELQFARYKHKDNQIGYIEIQLKTKTPSELIKETCHFIPKEDDPISKYLTPGVYTVQRIKGFAAIVVPYDNTHQFEIKIPNKYHFGEGISN